MGKVTFLWHPNAKASSEKDKTKNNDHDDKDECMPGSASCPTASSSTTQSSEPKRNQPQKGQEQQKGAVSSSSKGTTPVSVQGWFEMGSRFRSKIVQPKFMWRATYQPDLGQRRLSMSGRTPESLDILSMIRILTPTSIDRTKYPYVQLNRCFTIITNTNAQYVFEASTPAQRDWFVYGLKLVVARLASMVIVGDGQMFSEFFSPWAHSPLLDSSVDEGEDDDEDDDGEEGRGGETGSHAVNSKGSGSVSTARSLPRQVFVSTTDAERQSLWGTTPARSGRVASASNSGGKKRNNGRTDKKREQERTK